MISVDVSKAIFAFSFLVFSTPVFAQASLDSENNTMGCRQMLFEKLGITQEQRKQLACDTPGRGRQLRDQLMEENKTLNSMIFDKSKSEEQIRAQMDRVNTLEAERNINRLHRMLRARNVLTDSQLSELAKQSGNETFGCGNTRGRRFHGGR
jgi:Spy/CpxP family protein refolding chaperone